MTATLETWINAYRDTMRNKLECLEEALSHVDEQVKALSKEVHSFLNFLDMKDKLG